MVTMMTALPMFHPERPRLRLRPLKAFKHFRRLIANKESTEEVFYIFEALPRPSFLREAEEFVTSARGQQLHKEERALPAMLDDHAPLRKYPAGSLGHAYCDFMEREGLTAEGLVEEYDRFQKVRYNDMLEWFINRSRDTHDLLHVLTGYGRDPLGEACVLAFTYGQNPAPGNLFIAYLAGREIKRQTKRSGADIYAAINQARRHGKGAPKLVEHNISELLARPLSEVRVQFGIGEPTAYHACHKAFNTVGIDPHKSLKPNESVEQPTGQLAAA